MESEMQIAKDDLIISERELQKAERNRTYMEINFRAAIGRASDADRISSQDAMDAINNKGGMRGLAGLQLEIE